MKKNILLLVPSIILFIFLFVFLLGSVSFLKAQPFYYYFLPAEQTTSTGNNVTMKVMFGEPTDTINSIDAPPQSVSNWRVNGVSGDPNLLPTGNYASYKVPDVVPAINPIAISCDVLSSNGTDLTTIVTNITVRNDENEIVLNGVSYVIESSPNKLKNDYSMANVRGMLTPAGTVCTLTNNRVFISITFPGDKPGTFAWSQKTAVGGSIDKQGYGSLDPNTGQSVAGQTIVTEYGGIGERIKGTFSGKLYTQVGPTVYSVPVTGRFSVVHSK